MKKSDREYLKLVGRRLETARTEQHLTLKEAAATISISPRFLRKIEKGESDPKIWILFALCDQYKVNPVTVFTKK